MRLLGALRTQPEDRRLSEGHVTSGAIAINERRHTDELRERRLSSERRERNQRALPSRRSDSEEGGGIEPA